MTLGKNPSMIIGLGGGFLVILGILLTILAQLNIIASTRQGIDSTRRLIESLKKQQKNIDRVSQDFSTIDSQEKFASQQFLTEARAIEFYDAVDEVFSASGIAEQSIRVDSPIPGKELQLVGIHFSFAATYNQTQEVLRRITAINPLIHLETVALSSNNEVSPPLTVTADGTIPWAAKND
ncbi:MAG: hypothetical protein HY420_03860 [Candidatus Kerfeldbacteria bacterium]|nr:hypothetical protein [Candidatus Kerfeldbacteria bacterium]